MYANTWNSISESILQLLHAVKFVFSFYQRTPLHIAVKEGKGHTVKFLVEKGADINIKDKNGVSEIISGIADFVCFITRHLCPERMLIHTVWKCVYFYKSSLLHY